MEGDHNGDFASLKDDSEDDNRTKVAIEALIEHEDMKFTGGMLGTQRKAILLEELSKRVYESKFESRKKTKKYQVYENVIAPLIRAIVTTDIFMVE